jgi:hypothetical protein
VISLALAAALSVSGAKPPEPLEEIFPQTQLIVEAEVASIVKDEAGAQTLSLKITRVVRGALSPDEAKAGVVTVAYPQASAHRMKVGAKGPWLIAIDEKTKAKRVLGRYGPDTYGIDKIEAKLAELKPAHLPPLPAGN